MRIIDLPAEGLQITSEAFRITNRIIEKNFCISLSNAVIHVNIDTSGATMVSLLQIVVLVVFLGSQTHEAAVLNMQVPMNMTCPDPGTPDHASREDDLNSFLHGDKVIFTCEFTYQLIGSQTRTCLADGTWSGEQPVCRKFMCDELDAEIPKHGKRFGLNFNFGGQLTFKCSRNYLLIGEEKLTCLPSGQWSAKPPTCRHRCVQSPCRGKGEKCQVVGGATECVCRDNMDCSSKLESVCGSDAVTYNNECIMNATACRKKKDIRKIKSGKCEPGDICSIYPESNCRASFSMYYYNVTTRSCRHMVAGGCHASGWNGFWTRKECKDECQKDVCVLPADRGLCDKKETRWYYDNDKKSCEEFEYGGCFGNRNNFRTRDDCEQRCGKKI